MAGGQHHHRTNIDKYHPGYFGKVGMRYFHKTQQKFWKPTINLDKVRCNESNEPVHFEGKEKIAWERKAKGKRGRMHAAYTGRTTTTTKRADGTDCKIQLGRNQNGPAS
jgi:ribosomal protein L15